MSRVPPRRSRRSAGYTLLEMVVSMTILAVVLQAAVSSTIVMTQSSGLGSSELDAEAGSKTALRLVINELRTSSRDTDANGDPYMAVTGGIGQQSITFRRVAAFGDNGAEVVPIWSTPISLFLRDGQLLRSQDGVETLVANHVETLDFAIDTLGRVDVQIGFVRESAAAAGSVQRRIRHLRVTPQR